MHTYTPRGVCSRAISVELDGDRVSHVEFAGGCDGNLKAVSKLVRGMAVDEAIPVVDQYLDEAVLASLGEVSIIHGKGTGVLRQGIQQHLRHHPHVKSYRLGVYGEGESGVTVVTLK